MTKNAVVINGLALNDMGFVVEITGSTLGNAVFDARALNSFGFVVGEAAIWTYQTIEYPRTTTWTNQTIENDTGGLT